jgi:hypothetical protein
MSTPGQMSLFASAPSIFPSDDSPGSVQVTTSLVATGTIAAGSVPTVTMNSSAAAPLFGTDTNPSDLRSWSDTEFRYVHISE